MHERHALFAATAQSAASAKGAASAHGSRQIIRASESHAPDWATPRQVPGSVASAQQTRQHKAAVSPDVRSRVRPMAAGTASSRIWQRPWFVWHKCCKAAAASILQESLASGQARAIAGTTPLPSRCENDSSSHASDCTTPIAASIVSSLPLERAEPRDGTTWASHSGLAAAPASASFQSKVAAWHASRSSPPNIKTSLEVGRLTTSGPWSPAGWDSSAARVSTRGEWVSAQLSAATPATAEGPGLCVLGAPEVGTGWISGRVGTLDCEKMKQGAFDTECRVALLFRTVREEVGTFSQPQQPTQRSPACPVGK